MISVSVLSTRSGMLAGRKSYGTIGEDVSSHSTYFAIYHTVLMALKPQNCSSQHLCHIRQGRAQLYFTIVRLLEDDLLVVSEFSDKVSLGCSKSICQRIDQAVLRTPIGKHLTGRCQFEELTCAYDESMSALYCGLQANAPYFQSRKVLLVLTCPQILTLIGGFGLTNIASSTDHLEPAVIGLQDKSSNELLQTEQSHTDREVGGAQDFHQHISSWQSMFLVLRKFYRSMFSPCCSNSSNVVVPLPPPAVTSDNVELQPVLAVTKPRFVCQYMEPAGAPGITNSANAPDATSEDNEQGSADRKEHHAPTLTRNIICALSDHFKGNTAQQQYGNDECTRFLFNTETSEIRAAPRYKGCSGNPGIRAVNDDDAASSEEVRTSSTVARSGASASVVQQKTAYATSSGSLLTSQRSSFKAPRGGKTNACSSVPTASCSGKADVGASGGQAQATIRGNTVPSAPEHDYLEVMYFAETALLLVCRPTHHADGNVGPDLESQDLQDFLLMAQSCLQHKLIPSVRELPID